MRSYLADALSRGCRPSYLENELTHLQVGLRRALALDNAHIFPALTDAADAIARLKPFHETRQAQPAHPADIALLEHADPKRFGLLARCLWHAAARFSDLVGRLPARCMTFPAVGWLRIRYVLTKSAQTGAIRCCVVRLPFATWRRLLERVSAMPQRAAVFAFSRQSFNTWLRSFGLRLSSRSFRRGAVQVMMDADVPLREIRRLTGHVSDRTLLIYAQREPARAWPAMARAYAAMC